MALIKITQEVLNAAAGGIFLYKTLNQAYQLLEDKVLLKLDWAKNQKTKSSLKKIVAFADEGSSNFDTNKIMARMDATTIEMDAQYKELQSHANNQSSICDEIIHVLYKKAKSMQISIKNRFYNDYATHEHRIALMAFIAGSECINNRGTNYRSNTDDYPYVLQENISSDFMMSSTIQTTPCQRIQFMNLKTQLETVAKNHQASIQNLENKFDRLVTSNLVDLLDLFK
ncbi:hypothetical protein Tco_0412131 [Tanacetum coccineum]